ncbi:MAG: hypothetical protein P8N43_10805 [Alphaproteobacteria bacterium]|nr:hypothetical protein [Alphaproteobacteria bacterium]
MELSTICLSLLHEQPMTGYALHGASRTPLGTFSTQALARFTPL